MFSAEPSATLTHSYETQSTQPDGLPAVAVVGFVQQSLQRDTRWDDAEDGDDL